MRTERTLLAVLSGLAGVAGLVALFIVAFVTWEAAPALGEVGLLRFFTDHSWHPTEGQFGLIPMLLGTTFVTAGAVLVATPLGVGTAVFCHSYAPRAMSRALRVMLEVLAGTPSVVFGFWGLVTIVPLIARLRPPGTSLLAGITILSLMILPTVGLITHASLARIPDAYTRGAAALGLGRWATVRSVLLPAARSGIWTGAFLATARALGETMAVLMVCGNVVQSPRSLFDSVRTLPSNIALEMSYAMGGHRSALFVSGLLLLTMVGGLVLTADAIARRRAHA